MRETNKTQSGKRLYIRTFGCQMNFRDSEFVKGLLLDEGFEEAGSFDTADVILFNTCSVRKHAEDRVYANIWNLKGLKKKRPHLVIGVIGCMAQAKIDEIFDDRPNEKRTFPVSSGECVQGLCIHKLWL